MKTKEEIEVMIEFLDGFNCWGDEDRAYVAGMVKALLWAIGVVEGIDATRG